MSTLLDELLDYVGLDAADHARLVALHPRLEPHFPAIAERFYEAVWAHPGAAAVMSGPAQVERLRVTLIDWMSSGLLGPYDERFYEKRSRIGRRHVQIGLAHHYMFTSMNVVRTAYQDLITELYPPAEARDVVRAVNRLLDVELAIMVRHYQLDSEEKLIARERRMQVDRMTAMQTMTAGLAHEVRNPLNAAKLQLELLDRRLRRQLDDARLLEPSSLAQKEIERLTALLDDFLAFARPPELDAHEADLVEIVRHVCDLERIAAEQRGATLELRAEGAPITARVDAPKLQQIVLNLVRNAVEAVSANGKVIVGVEATHDEGIISIADTGPGIPPAARARIYEPFFSTKETGTGLGMSIVHSLVGLHGGSIDFDTGPQGTLFRVRLPRR
ncbi:MAG TPA: protoglobin domain-containing protein [Kofleriaceae bacterium]|nr:protoglobin domain-containing protein [Kofleriaceae bacterium]